jgi:hypothetical protein
VKRNQTHMSNASIDGCSLFYAEMERLRSDDPVECLPNLMAKVEESANRCCSTRRSTLRRGSSRDVRPQRPARPDRAKQMDHTTERHYAEERQQT